MNHTTYCVECDRKFDLLDELDADEFYHGHDCEDPIDEVFWDYIFEFRRLLAMPEDANVRDAEFTAEVGPETPDERMATIEHILVCQHDFPWPIDYIYHIDVSHRKSGHYVNLDSTLCIQPAQHPQVAAHR